MKNETFLIYINGKLYLKMNYQNTLERNRVDAIWHLGAKFGGVTYNEMVRKGQIVWSDDKVIITN